MSIPIHRLSLLILLGLFTSYLYIPTICGVSGEAVILDDSLLYMSTLIKRKSE